MINIGTYAHTDVYAKHYRNEDYIQTFRSIEDGNKEPFNEYPYTEHVFVFNFFFCVSFSKGKGKWKI